MLLNVLLFVLSIALIAAAVTQHIFRRLGHYVSPRLCVYVALFLSGWGVWRTACLLFVGQVEGAWCNEGLVFTLMGNLLAIAALFLIAAVIRHNWLRYIEHRRHLEPNAFSYL